MSYRNILVHVDSSPGCVSRIQLACFLAQQFNAHLTGIFTAGLPNFKVNMAEIVTDIMAETQAYAERCAKMAHETFKQVVQEMGADKSEWCQHIGRPIESLCLNARYHDLVVMGQHNPEQSIDNLPKDFVELTVLSAGRPILIVPYAGSFVQCGRKVLVAWNASQEATRALTDALPLLKMASKTWIQTMNSRRLFNDQVDLPDADISLFLARHSVAVELLKDMNNIADEGNQLLSIVAGLDADLLVMGAYGHSRIFEIFLGGATRAVLESMTVPVLMSH
ncbi:universal stress protein [Neisseriaceae bacterium JH1-16]|nr:universal stress protein [Neisseriaceae bacterium JH1-16]